MEENLAVVSQVACSSANDRGLFNLYVKFDWSPDESIATMTIRLV